MALADLQSKDTSSSYFSRNVQANASRMHSGIAKIIFAVLTVGSATSFQRRYGKLRNNTKHKCSKPHHCEYINAKARLACPTVTPAAPIGNHGDSSFNDLTFAQVSASSWPDTAKDMRL
jgi:hypothetical protein